MAVRTHCISKIFCTIFKQIGAVEWEIKILVLMSTFKVLWYRNYQCWWYWVYWPLLCSNMTFISLNEKADVIRYYGCYKFLLLVCRCRLIQAYCIRCRDKHRRCNLHCQSRCCHSGYRDTIFWYIWEPASTLILALNVYISWNRSRNDDLTHCICSSKTIIMS